MGTGKTYSTKYLLDSNNSSGVAGQVLISTSTGVNWSDGSDITGGPYLPLAGGTMTTGAVVTFLDSSGSTNNRLKFGTGSDLQIYHNGSTSYVDQTGVGKLVLNTLNTGINIQAGSGETRFTKWGQNSEVKVDDASQVNKVVLKSNGNSYFNGGNVGIGVTAPTSTVHVDGLQTNSGSTSAHLPTGTMRLNFAGADGANDYGASLVFTQRWWTGSTGEVAMGQIAGVKETGSGNYGGGLAFFTSNNTSNNLLERLRINELGNVGIGTITPTEKLEVDGIIKVVHTDNTYTKVKGTGLYFNRSNVYIAPEGDNVSALNVGLNGQRWSQLKLNADTFTVSRAAAEFMRITSSGNVGIGTTAPDSKLNINGNSGDPSATYTTTAANSTISIGDFGASGLRMLFGVNPSTPSTWIQNQYTTNQVTAKLLLNPLGGNVGVGTTSPVVKLQVDGTITSTGALTAYTSVPSINIGHNGTSAFIAGTSGGGANTSISFSVGNNAEKMRITSAGGVSFGSTGTAYGTSGQILKSNGNTSPTWINGSAIPGVPGGSGTVNTVPLWTPDGDTLSNSIITQPTSAEIRVSGTLKVSSTVSGYSSTKIQTGGFSDSQSGINILNSTTGYGYILFGDGSGADLYRGQISYKHGDDFMAFNTNGSEKTRITSTGNVGIGTTAPYAYDTTTTKLHVRNAGSSGSISEVARLEGASDADGSGAILRIGTSNDRGIYLEGGRTGSVPYASIGTTEYNGAKTEGIRITSTGNVGIGTTSPTYKLHVVAASAPIAKFEGTLNGYVDFSDASSSVRLQNSGHSYFGTQTNTNLNFKTNGSEKMTILAGGNVGIGTTSPTNELEVLGGGSPRISLRTTSETVSEALELGFQVGTGANSSANSVGIIKSVITQANPSALKGDLVFQTNSGDSVSTKMVIKDDGNVGIGTTGIDSILHIKDTGKIATLTIESDANMAGGVYFISPTSTNGSISMDSDGDFRISNSANTGFLLTGDTAPLLALGVNNTSPTQQLHLNDNIRVEGAYYDSTNSAGSNGQVLSSTNSGTATAWVTPSSGGTSPWVATTSPAGIKYTAGKVGIGTDPSSQQDLAVGSNGIITGAIKSTGQSRLDGLVYCASEVEFSDTIKLGSMTTTQINAISSPSAGLTIYNTTLNTICFYNGSNWQKVTSTNM